MTALVAAVAVVAIAYVGGATTAGLRRSSVTLASFRPKIGTLTSDFQATPSEVVDAYAAAIPRVPGMSVLDREAGRLLVDLKPTSRILGGSFGLVVRIEAKPSTAGARTTVTARPKVPWAVLANQQAALVHAERALRMQAKKRGLRESIGTAAR